MKEHEQFLLDAEDHAMQRLDVNLDQVWFGISGEIWSSPVGRLERTAGSLLRSPALARALSVTPSLVFSWILASAAVFALGVMVANTTNQPIVPLLAPAVASIAVSFAYGAGADPAYEVARTMPVSSRMIMLLRVFVVFATNALLGVAASFVEPDLARITMLWLLPMVTISLLGLAVAVTTHSATIGSLVALAVWSAIVVVAQIRTDNMAAAVSGDWLASLTPFYLMVGAISLIATCWVSGDGSRRRELAGWL